MDMLSALFLFAQNGYTNSKTKTLNFLKVTKLVFVFYFFPLARLLSACSEIYYEHIFCVLALNKLGHAFKGLDSCATGRELLKF